jgi:hypothetical protein
MVFIFSSKNNRRREKVEPLRRNAVILTARLRSNLKSVEREFNVEFNLNAFRTPSVRAVRMTALRQGRFDKNANCAAKFGCQSI